VTIEWLPINTRITDDLDEAVLGFGDGDLTSDGTFRIQGCVYVMDWDGENWRCFYSCVILYPTHWAPWPNTPNEGKEQ
jgi:hypothetical protein